MFVAVCVRYYGSQCMHLTETRKAHVMCSMELHPTFYLQVCSTALDRILNWVYTLKVVEKCNFVFIGDITPARILNEY